MARSGAQGGGVDPGGREPGFLFFLGSIHRNAMNEVTMPSGFKPSDIRKLEKLFGVPVKPMGQNYRFEIAMDDQERKLSLEIYPNTRIGSRKGDLISVWTVNGHLQLHHCSGYVVSELLGEVTFVGEQAGKLSGLIVERQGGCSLFANVDRELVSGDFTRLGPEVMLSGIALSLTDTILDAPAPPKSRKKKSTRAGARVRA